MNEDKRHIIILDFQNWKRHLIKFKFYIMLSVLLFVIAGVMNYFCGNYADRAYLSPDLILDNIPVLNWGHFFVYGVFVVIGFYLLYPLFFRLGDFCYTLNQWAFLVIIRNITIILSPLNFRPEAAPISFPWPINSWNFDNDLFFSGHVAVPFLGFLIFKDKKIKYIFLALTILMAVITILTHRHYSIDVFAAPFMAYACYKLFDWVISKTKTKKFFGRRD